MGFEPAIPLFERTKTVHALERGATVSGFQLTMREIIKNTGLYLQTVLTMQKVVLE
jgi:hypothetical protein